MHSLTTSKQQGKTDRMATNIKRIIYFHQRIDATAARVKSLRLRHRHDAPQLRCARPRRTGRKWPARTAITPVPAPRCASRGFPDAKLIARAPNLLAVCSLGAGYDVIDVDACTKAGILVCNQSGANKEAVAEHALGFMLALSKKMVIADRAMRRDKNLERFLYTGNDLLGKTIGIIGLGNIGSRVAELCKGLFKMDVLAYDPYLTKEQIGARNGDEGRAERAARSAPTTSPCTARAQRRHSA